MSFLSPSLFALLLGSACLFFAGGMHGLLLPVRGAIEGFSDAALGALGAGWAIGYIVGCLVAPRLVAQVGHVRAFGVVAAVAAISVLLSALLLTPYAWVPLRALAGFAFSGAAMVVESWLNDSSDAARRGRVFGVYTTVNLGATTLGQMALASGDAGGFTFFALAAVFYALALLPTAVSAVAQPRPLVRATLDLRALWANSPVAVFAAIVIGVANGGFGTLGPVYAQQAGLDLLAISLFMSMALLAGAAAQFPVGALSDRMDRRVVLMATVLAAIVCDLVFLLAPPASSTGAIVVAAVLGAAIYSLYPLIVTHANDHAAAGDAILVSGGLLLLYGVGAIFGPLLAGLAMSSVGPRGLFLTMLAAHIALAAYTAWRITRRAPAAEKGVFVVTSPARTSTPQTIVLARPKQAGSPPAEPPRSGVDDQSGETRPIK